MDCGMETTLFVLPDKNRIGLPLLRHHHTALEGEQLAPATELWWIGCATGRNGFASRPRFRKHPWPRFQRSAISGSIFENSPAGRVGGFWPAADSPEARRWQCAAMSAQLRSSSTGLT